MSRLNDRRQFMRTSLVAGAALGLASDASRLGGFPAGTNPAREANRRVQPGLVSWHRDFAAACAARRGSGKPVMHFFMMGRLDQELC